MSKDIFEIINPTNTLGVCRPLAHILGACETIVYNALLGISIECAFGNIAEYLHLLVFIALTDNSSGALCQIRRPPGRINIMRGIQKRL